MRATDGSGELPVASYELFSQTDVLGRMAMERMLAGLSTRRYPVGLEPVGTRTEQAATATSKSAVSRRFVTATETALAELLSADLSGLDLVALMVDGVHFAEYCCVVALGIDIDGVKHPLSLVEGSTENATLVTDLLVGLRERGLDVTRPILVVIDGSKADGRKHLLHLAVGNKESQACWMEFFRSMLHRGMRAPMTITSDGAPGLINAITACFPASIRVRCWFHRLA